MSEVLWKTSKSKGSYTRLLTPSEEFLRRLGINEEGDFEHCPKYAAPGPKRPLAYRFDFIEVFAGSAKVTAAMAQLGVAVGPPIELSFSEEYDVSERHVVAWLSYLVRNRLVLAIMVEPPCTTFSIIRRPALRSRFEPYGFQPREEKTFTGNMLAGRACQLMSIAGINRVAGLLETPFSSLLKHLPCWQSVQRMMCSKVVRVDSCRFGSPHLKSFRMLCVHLSPKHIDRRCMCTCKHVQVQGRFTKASATYTDRLAEALALDFADWIFSERRKLLSDSEPSSKGLESVAINDLAISCDWSVDAAWNFWKESHINILEESALLRMAQRCAHLRYPTRITAMVDSNVVRGASSKGRSSSLGLSTVLRRFNAICVAAALYVNIAFVPTRLNVADDPTRDTVLRDPTPGFELASLDRQSLFGLCSIPRWAANWTRLILRTAGIHLVYLGRRDLYRKSFPSGFLTRAKGFDSTLGYPGEGPSLLPTFGLLFLGFFGPAVFPVLVGLFTLRPLGFRRFACCVLLFVELVSHPPVGFWGAAMAMPLSPKTPGEIRKAEQRRLGDPLPDGRPVLPTTGSTRERYLSHFYDWARSELIDVDHLLENPSIYVEEINAIVSRYGRLLYQAGKTYTTYAETINGLTSVRPSLRRQMQGAWDLGYAWMRQEPSQHHAAMPGVILLAILTTSLLWGWTHFAGSVALAWGALLRPGELFSLRRRNLLFPSDSGFSVPYLLVSLMEPKTRFTAARHQSTRLDIPDLLKLVTMIFEKLPPHYPLWPFSPQTFRNRFRAVIGALGMPTQHSISLKCLDPGSLRAGGATWLLQTTDNGELVRRRGRWQNHRIMEVYIQDSRSVLPPLYAKTA